MTEFCWLLGKFKTVLFFIFFITEQWNRSFSHHETAIPCSFTTFPTTKQSNHVPVYHKTAESCFFPVIEMTEFCWLSGKIKTVLFLIFFITELLNRSIFHHETAIPCSSTTFPSTKQLNHVLVYHKIAESCFFPVMEMTKFCWLLGKFKTVLSSRNSWTASFSITKQQNHIILLPSLQQSSQIMFYLSRNSKIEFFSKKEWLNFDDYNKTTKPCSSPLFPITEQPNRVFIYHKIAKCVLLLVVRMTQIGWLLRKIKTLFFLIFFGSKI